MDRELGRVHRNGLGREDVRSGEFSLAVWGAARLRVRRRFAAQRL